MSADRSAKTVRCGFCGSTGDGCPHCDQAHQADLRALMREQMEQDLDGDDADMDVCHHMVGFDESCEWCDLEEFEERRAKQLAKQPQQELPL